jgi:hypothetical protein
MQWCTAGVSAVLALRVSFIGRSFNKKKIRNNDMTFQIPPWMTPFCATWLTESDHAATTGETEGVSEVQDIADVTRDFLRAIIKVAPTWMIEVETAYEHENRGI